MTIFNRHVDGHLAGGMHLQDAADDNAVGAHIVIVIAPFAGRARGGRAF